MTYRLAQLLKLSFVRGVLHADMYKRLAGC
jgi:hypothetical protein